jgi:inositol transport system ATP-binding protein
MDHECVLEVRNLSKSFPGVRALEGVRLDVRRGAVHAIMGENGAGKSTLMKTLAGLHQPDAGEIRLRGRAVRLGSPHEALRLGIAMIHQELMPLANLTVAENISLGQEPTRWFPGWLDKPAMNRRARELLGRLGVDLSPTERMKHLSVAQMQTVEIAKALAYRAEVLIMDEPTSAISDHEVDKLFEVIGDLKRRGVAILYISHKMEEVFRIADQVTVLRDGQYVGTHDIAALSPPKLIALMVGRELPASRPQTPKASGEIALEVRKLSRAGRFQDVGFQIRRGEVLGLAGLMGAGRTEVVSAIFGLFPADAGEIRVGGHRVRIASPRDAIARGIAMVTEDRQIFGLVGGMSVKQNVTLASLARCCRAGVIDHGRENRVADRQIEALAPRPRSARWSPGWRPRARR